MERGKERVLKGRTWYTDKEGTEKADMTKENVRVGRVKKPFQKDGNKVKTSTVIFVPRAQEGVLVRKL